WRPRLEQPAGSTLKTLGSCSRYCQSFRAKNRPDHLRSTSTERLPCAAHLSINLKAPNCRCLDRRTRGLQYGLISIATISNGRYKWVFSNSKLLTPIGRWYSAKINAPLSRCH